MIHDHIRTFLELNAAELRTTNGGFFANPWMQAQASYTLAMLWPQATMALWTGKIHPMPYMKFMPKRPFF